MALNVYARALKDQSRGKGAVYIRGLLEFLKEQPESVSLREAQESGMKYVETKNTSISLNYMKTCHRSLQECELITQVRAGKSFVIEITDQGVEWLESLTEGWGTDPLTERADDITKNDPGAMVEVEERPNRRFKAGQEIDRAVWKAYYAAFRAGDLDLVFVEKGRKFKLVKNTD